MTKEEKNAYDRESPGPASRPAEKVSTKKSDRNLLIASWNIKEFGHNTQRLMEQQYTGDPNNMTNPGFFSKYFKHPWRKNQLSNISLSGSS